MTFASIEDFYLAPPEPHDCELEDCDGEECETAARELMESDAEHRAEADRDEAGW